ncbi:hypothetical protein AMS58_11430 [Pseudoalteromonas porphyrae]|uniref:hypothetical protein n=1 Tax=Pseudoalteromonas porphyrae TaxID=187330 RepID=UPI0006BA8710|nr:hypothetical protein [Pseudoalteromonas porphyrae]KPH94603.1 hypothetical protein AMS58_11430 [Pseudoalteromonas porphyrae]
MEHTFYLLTRQQQHAFQLKLAGLFIVGNLVLAGLFFMLSVLFLSIFAVSISLSVFAPFIDIPSGIKAGSLKYYSPLLIGEKVKNARLVLHGGSLFDYYFVLNSKDSAQQRTKQVFSGYIEGLLTLISEYENHQPTHITLKASSYIINPRTANKLGLRQVETDPLQRLILYFNFINLSCAMSLIKGKFTLVNMKKVYTFEGDLDVLITKKQYLVKLQQRIKGLGE